MATIVKEEGFEIRIYPNDHEPYNVHVFKAGGEARIKIGGQDEDPDWISVTNMSDKDAIKALKLVAKHQDQLNQKWQEYDEQRNSSQPRIIEQIGKSPKPRRKKRSKGN